MEVLSISWSYLLVSQIHHGFHVSQLKEAVGNVVTTIVLPSVVSDVLIKEHELILGGRWSKDKGRLRQRS